MSASVNRNDPRGSSIDSAVAIVQHQCSISCCVQLGNLQSVLPPTLQQQRSIHLIDLDSCVSKCCAVHLRVAVRQQLTSLFQQLVAFTTPTASPVTQNTDRLTPVIWSNVNHHSNPFVLQQAQLRLE